MKIALSLFDGISCGQLALQRAGISVDYYLASEVETKAIEITMGNFPDTIQLGDVRELDGSAIVTPYILLGGSPCQCFSFAGKRKGMATTEGEEITTLDRYLELKKEGFEFEGQSYLFWEYVRILNETKPKYFLLENVRMTEKWEDVISETLGVRPIVINSARVSAQNRKRLYWTNIPDITQPEDRGLLLRDILDSGKVDREKALCITKRYEGFSGSQSYLRRRYFGKSMGQAVFENCEPSEQREMWKADDRKEYDTIGIIRSLTTRECEKLQTLPIGYVEDIIGDNMKAKGVIGNGWTVDVIAHILSHIPEEEK